jgi:hypothetical protein
VIFPPDDLVAYIRGLKDARQRLVCLLALSKAFGRLEHDEDLKRWTREALAKVKPTREEYTDILVEAARVSSDLRTAMGKGVSARPARRR